MSGQGLEHCRDYPASGRGTQCSRSCPARSMPLARSALQVGIDGRRLVVAPRRLEASGLESSYPACGWSLLIAATSLIHIPGQLYHGQKNILLTPSGRNRRFHNVADDGQQLPLAFGRQIDVGTALWRTIEIKPHNWRSPRRQLSNLTLILAIPFLLICDVIGRNIGAPGTDGAERLPHQTDPHARQRQWADRASIGRLSFCLARNFFFTYSCFSISVACG